MQRILDAADIVEVVSDFVTLKKRGANYIGLCPFHNERTPSFSVSKSKGICKCFSCGKGGSPVNFIMEHEQMNFNEALRYLAKKYNIEIREHEVSDAEKEKASEREAMIAINDFALSHFEHNITDTPDGRDIGLAYFRERGISDAMIKRFRLGYALDKPDDLLNAALAKGYSEKYLIETGLCARTERGTVYDKYKGRVIYPILSVSGRVVGFGGRTLRKDKNVAKYVNSPESEIYHKSLELYGMYQAKSAIAKADKCILVEGYMDVISMHQAGVENVLASSGTSLTEGQARLIHRFTNNATVIYDADAAGIKASLRAIDILLAEGIDIKLCLLPEGEDPDSFAQSRSASQVEEYIAANEVDFVTFKSNILLKDAGNDPIKRAAVISDILKSVATITDPVKRTVFMTHTSRMFDIDERVLSLQIAKTMADNAEKAERKPASQEPAEAPAPQQPAKAATKPNSRVRAAELPLIKYVIKYGLLPMGQSVEQDDQLTDLTVIDCIRSDFEADELEFTDPTARKIFSQALDIYTNQWPEQREHKLAQLSAEKQTAMANGHERIRLEAKDLSEIEVMEQQLAEETERNFTNAYEEYCCRFLEDAFLSDPEDDVRRLATDLAAEKYQLSKVHTKYAHVETERERIGDLVQRGLLELKFAILDESIDALNEQLKDKSIAPEKMREMMSELYEMYQLKSQFAKILGDRIVNPR